MRRSVRVGAVVNITGLARCGHAESLVAGGISRIRYAHIRGPACRVTERTKSSLVVGEGVVLRVV